ncbi:MAG: hypothetical protein DWQ07_25790 [Chloroflexi bacterium]|nr:MAG: hypothetical protein DWQ07_25790 [Chloroflexota bacterium]
MSEAKLLQPNDTFIGGDGKKYRVVSFLGPGRTAYVYEAINLESNNHVAIKVMRPDLNSDMQRMFNSEGPNLRLLSAFLAGKDAHLIPELYAYSDEAPVYIAEELVRGKKLIHMVGEGQAISEQIGVMVCLQFAQLLQTLHDQYKKVYADMKYENIWWVESEKSIRVTDWNVIADVSEAGVKQDILKYSTYAARIFLDYMPETRGDLILDELSERSEWQNISFGVQSFLRKALHINPAYRYKTMAEIVSDLEILAGFWQMDRLDLTPNIHEILENAEAGTDQELQVKQFQMARSAFEIAKQKFTIRPTEASDFSTRINRGLEGSDYISIGKEFFESTDYKRASENFESGYQKAIGDPRFARRWWDLAKTATTVGTAFSAYKVILRDAVINMNAEKYADAVSLFETALPINDRFHIVMQEVLSSKNPQELLANYKKAKDLLPELTDLIVEASAWKGFREGRALQEREEYTKAQQAYNRSQALVSLLPEELRAFVPDIVSFRDEAKRLSVVVEDFGENVQQAEALLQNGKINEATALYEKAYTNIVGDTASPKLKSNSPELQALWQSLARQAEILLADNNYRGAEELYQLGLKYYSENDKFRFGLWQAKQLNILNREDVRNDPILAFEHLLHILHYMEDIRDYPAVWQTLQTQVPDVLTRILDLKEYALSRRLLLAARHVDETFCEEYLDTIYHHKVDEEHNAIETDVRNFLGKARTAIDVHADQIDFRTDLDEVFSDAEDALEAAAELAIKSPKLIARESLLREIRTIRSEYIGRIKQTLSAKEESSNLTLAANTKQTVEGDLNYVEGLRKVIDHRMLDVAQSIQGNQSIEWFAVIREVRDLLEQIQNRLTAAKISIEKTLNEVESGIPDHYELQELLQEIEGQLHELDSEFEKRNQEEEELIAEAQANVRKLINQEHISQAKTLLKSIDHLITRHPHFDETQAQLRDRIENYSEKKYVPSRVFWIAQGIGFISMFIIFAIAFIGWGQPNFGVVIGRTATAEILAAQASETVAALLATDTPLPVTETPTSAPPTETPTITPTPTTPPCEFSAYPNAISIIGPEFLAEPAPSQIQVRWVLENNGYCGLLITDLIRTGSTSRIQTEDTVVVQGSEFPLQQFIDEQVLWEAGVEIELTHLVSYSATDPLERTLLINSEDGTFALEISALNAIIDLLPEE